MRRAESIHGCATLPPPLGCSRISAGGGGPEEEGEEVEEKEEKNLTVQQKAP